MQIEITKQSEKDFRFLLSRLSHEIRNPVTLINSELQLMASSHPELCSYRQWDSLMAPKLLSTPHTATTVSAGTPYAAATRLNTSRCCVNFC